MPVLLFITCSGEFMAVGWGKKETQFHGSEGKQAAHQRKEVSHFCENYRMLFKEEWNCGEKNYFFGVGFSQMKVELEANKAKQQQPLERTQQLEINSNNIDIV